MKRIQILIAVFIFYFLLLPSSVYAAGATLSLSPATGTLNRGCSFSVEIKLDTGGAQTDGTDVILLYIPTQLEAKSIKPGTVYAEFPGSSIDSQLGKINISGIASAASAFVGSGTLATVDFTVLETAPTGVTQLKFDFDPNDKGKSIDSNVVERGTVTDILNQVNNATFTIGSGSCSSSAVTVTPRPRGGGDDIKVVPTVPGKILPESGGVETTMVLTVVGGILTIIGILGLALL